ncbi:MAG TPA: VOC family protein [Gemmatimonadaceae bacterium]|nr:VOC family protein [Gemmatimonadaceae bacterium]
MGATTNDLFGGANGAEPATPGSYGEPPSGFRLPAATRLGPVRLDIADLARSLDFYTGTLGLRISERDGARAVLAANGAARPLVELVERPGARPAPHRGRLGLYHFAILLPDRPSLGQFAQHLAEVGARAGAGDHLVSEALYLQDPDNLGIEVYADRPRSSWRRVGRQLMMATDPVDVAGLVRAGGGTRWSGMPAGTVMGHVHLHVGAIEPAAAFFSEALGFDRTVWSYPGALFLSAGGYHHHLGANTWAGVGARAPEAGDTRLAEWTIELPEAASVAAAAASASSAGYAMEWDGADVVARDPWGTQVRLSVGRAVNPTPSIQPEPAKAARAP